jgi:glycosyltransferase involved in cell wall biosynthesis
MAVANSDSFVAFDATKVMPRWTVVVPFHNERGFLPATLRSLALQSVRFRLVLVDNGSTDGSAEIALAICREIGLSPVLRTECRPGKVAALQCGIDEVLTELVATCDADTIYPHDYLARAEALLDLPAVVAAAAATSRPAASALRRKIAGLHLAVAAFFLRQQCLNGGAGQVFRNTALRAAGGFDPLIWNWVLEDHEIMARVEREGLIAYHSSFHCAPASRPRTGVNVSWRLVERLRYHLTTSSSRHAFFHGFLSPRLRQRAVTSDRLRRGASHFEDRAGIAVLHPLRR